MQTENTSSLISTELEKIRSLLVQGYSRHDICLASAEAYLEWAQRCNLEGPHVVASCLDLAATTASQQGDVVYIEIKEEKRRYWERLKKNVLGRARSSRVVTMQLYPLYFNAILEGRKPFEGRAFDPDSDKNYPDMRSGDIIQFSICQEGSDWEIECRKLGLNPGMIMEVTVRRVLFAPLVHEMFNLTPHVGIDFQPDIHGPSELLHLQRAAIYYTFPEYPERIRKHGFIGIEVEKPRVIQ